MRVIFEVEGPVQWRPGLFRSRCLTRVWWLFFAVSVLHVSLREFSEIAYRWSWGR